MTIKTLNWKTREINIGKVRVGGNQPIRIQSMTTSNTRDVEATIEQIIKLADRGCEIARVTVQGMKEAEACEGIKNGLLKRGYDIPLVADIHFYPPAAMKVADFADKVRVNPGNYVDKRAIFKKIEYDDATYQQEILKIEEGFSPLVEKCIRLNRAMRIGVNHGSLSDRIMNRYGDTPAGMVESAFEFARVCRKLGFHDFCFSMKASNPVVMIEAYRLLALEMSKIGWDYPLHLGVTEAGLGEDGRIKSAVGIGSLLLDGIGDTIRVSLTEDPWEEIDPCKRLVHLYEKRKNAPRFPFPQTINIDKIDVPAPLHRDGSVILPVTLEQVLQDDFFEQIGCKVHFGRIERTISTIDAILLEMPIESEKLERLKKAGIGVIVKDQEKNIAFIEADQPWEALLQSNPSIIFFSFKEFPIFEGRKFFDWLKAHQIQVPVIWTYENRAEKEDFIIHAASECGALLADKLGHGVCLKGPHDLRFLSRLSFNLLQACRMRSVKTDFISCPGCGRTLFDLQEVTKRIQSKTAHLPGVKIAIMGCIVNGPGEMADADFGYVGSKPGKIDLYIGKKCVQKDIAFADADEKLIELIKAQGRWEEPEAAENTAVLV
ncbi:MAG TPA: (E)-4-hydroxy-3-methylbut-2-enyl-diphosphate synthase [Rhabdochlamydiaceae bacterium]|nr:(E)-4-hydroxy-3-methylbut-2-enyl-diphosphate synthase [Rhabdochlamydiaceae bacterium]